MELELLSFSERAQNRSLELYESSRAVIAKYCTEAANARVPHSTLTGTGLSLGSAAHVGCAIGYERNASSTSATATCVALNATHGLWRGLDLTCERTPSASAFEYCIQVVAAFESRAAHAHTLCTAAFLRAVSRSLAQFPISPEQLALPAACGALRIQN